MNYWFVKLELDEYGFFDLQVEGMGCWDGVCNYVVCNYLCSMCVGDLVFFYYSWKGFEVVGICKVVCEVYFDFIVEKGDWSVVDMAVVKLFLKFVFLKAIKDSLKLQEMLFVCIGRLLVMLVMEVEFYEILKMGNIIIE